MLPLLLLLLLLPLLLLLCLALEALGTHVSTLPLTRFLRCSAFLLLCLM